MSPEYRAAIESARAASIKFSAAQHAYRARLIGDTEFLAARAEWLESDKAFDAAYAAEDAREASKYSDDFLSA